MCTFQLQNAVQGGDPISQSGFSSSTILIAISLSAALAKFQGVPSGLRVLKSIAERPLQLRARRLPWAAITIRPWPYASMKVTGGGLITEYANRVASTGFTPRVAMMSQMEAKSSLWRTASMSTPGSSCLLGGLLVGCGCGVALEEVELLDRGVVRPCCSA